MCGQRRKRPALPLSAYSSNPLVEWMAFVVVDDDGDEVVEPCAAALRPESEAVAVAAVGAE